MATKITSCSCCGSFDCGNINPYETQEWNDTASNARYHGMQEEFHQKRGNGTMYHWHKERRLELEKQLTALEQKS